MKTNYMEQTLKRLTAPTSRKLYNVLNPLPPEKLITTRYIFKNIEPGTSPAIHKAINLFLAKGWLIRICQGAYIKGGEFKNNYNA
jgi:hypothetical protein